MNSNMKIKKRRGKIPKKVLFFLLSLGIAGVCIGVVLSAVALMQAKYKLLWLGLIYIAVFGAVLFIRSAIIQYESARKRNYATGR